jgi:septal ring-binding cell division protein DamX
MAEVFPISGSIDPKTFPFLLADLHRRSATGSFKVGGPSYQKALYFRAGRILFGSSNDPRDQLGSILIEDGKITPEQLEDVNSKVGPGKPLAKVLAETGVVSQRELSDAARAKVERILSDVIAYTSGSFEFEDGVLPKGAVDLKLSTERLVVAAVRRVSDRNFVLRHLDSLDVVLSRVSGTDERWAELQSDASGLPEQLDGRTNLKEAISRTRLDEFEAAKVACALLFLGLVERTGTGAAPSAEVPMFTPADTGEELHLGGGPELSFASLEPKNAPATIEAEPMVVPEPAASAEPVIQAEPEPLFVSEPVPARPPEPGRPIETSAPSPIPELVAPMPEPLKAEPGVAQAKTEPPRPSPSREPPIVPAPRREPPRPAPKPVTPRPASKEDLAALDFLLNPRTHEGPLEPLEKSPIGASFDAARGRMGAPPPRRGRRIAFFLIAAAVLIALPVAIYYINSPLKPVRPEPGTQVAAAGPAVPRRSPSPVTASPTASPLASALASARPSGPSSGPPSGLPSGPPSGPATAAASVAPSPPSRSPAAASPTPRTAASPSPRPPAVTDPRALMAQGRYPDAARGFLSQFRSARAGSATVQLLVACSADTVQKAVENVKGTDLFILPVDLKGRECFRLCWGLFDSEPRAAAALRTVPKYFREGGASPRVVSTASIVR